MKRWSAEEILEIARKRGGTCSPPKTFTLLTPLSWECAKGHSWTATTRSIQNGSWCLSCASNRALEVLSELARSFGGKCLSEQYISGRTPMKWQCAEMHAWETNAENVRHGHWCPTCADQRTQVNRFKPHHSIEGMRTFVAEKGGQCLSETYINSKTKLRWACHANHEWLATPENILRGRWCPECHRSRTKKVKHD